MVARRILVPPVRVRILPRQLIHKNAYSFVRRMGVFNHFLREMFRLRVFFRKFAFY